MHPSETLSKSLSVWLLSCKESSVSFRHLWVMSVQYEQSVNDTSGSSC